MFAHSAQIEAFDPMKFSLSKYLKWFEEYERNQSRLPRPDVFINAITSMFLMTVTEDNADDWGCLFDFCIRQLNASWMTHKLARNLMQILEKLADLDIDMKEAIDDYVLYMISLAAVTAEDKTSYLGILQLSYWQKGYQLEKSEQSIDTLEGFVSANTATLFNTCQTQAMAAHHSHEGATKDRYDNVVVGLDSPDRFKFSALRIAADAQVQQHHPQAARYHYQYIESVHDKAYLAKLKTYSLLSRQLNLRLPIDKYGDTMMSPNSFQAAIEGAYMTMELVNQSYIQDKPSLVMARPPGHHAGTNFGEGFCLINNVACAAMLLIGKHQLQKVMILDIDAHKGGGTQDIVSRVQKIREHVVFYDFYYEQTYSGCEEMQVDSIEESSQVRCKPLPKQASTAQQKALLDRIKHRVEKTRADYVLVSFGLDGHKRDPLAGELGYSDEFYTGLVAIVHEQMKGRCAFVVEGGYNQTVNMRLINHSLDILNGGVASSSELSAKRLEAV